MALIVLEDVSLDYPVYDASRSLRKTLFRHNVGGLIERRDNHRSLVTVTALNEISFRLEHGDRVALIGRNGAGKSTLLRVLAGVYKPRSGMVKIEGRVSPLFDASITMDFDDTGYENILAGGLLLGLKPLEIKSKFALIEEFTGLGDYLAMPVRTYSLGMQLRLAFSIATVVDPDILLLDEAIGASDAEFKEKAQDRTLELASRSNILVVASHSTSMLTALCDKAIHLEHGKILGFGPIEEILDQYQRSGHQPARG